MHCNLAIVQPHQCCHHHRCHSHHHQHHHGRYDHPHQLHLVFRVIAESPNGNFLSFLQPQPFLWSLSLFKNCRVSERFPCLFRHRKCHFRSYLVLTTETFEPLSPWASVYTVSGKKLPATITPWSRVQVTVPWAPECAEEIQATDTAQSRPWVCLTMPNSKV